MRLPLTKRGALRRAIHQVMAYTPQPGDVVILQTEQDLPQMQVARLESYAKSRFGKDVDVCLVVLTGGVHFVGVVHEPRSA